MINYISQTIKRVITQNIGSIVRRTGLRMLIQYMNAAKCQAATSPQMKIVT